MAGARELHQTDRLPVTHVEEGDAYAIELPADFEDAYKVNGALIHFYHAGEDEPLDSFEMDFSEKHVSEIEALELPDDQYAECEFDVVFLYHPEFELPYERVREAVTELQPAEALDGRVTAASALVDADEMGHVDYLRIDIRDPETGDYVTGDVVPIDDASDRTDDKEAVLATGAVQMFPSEFAGFEAEITYLST